MAKKNIVAAGAVVAKVGDSERYFYQGAELVGVDAKEISRLSKLGLVKQVEVPDPEPEKKSEEPGKSEQPAKPPAPQK